jgi:peptidoglycan/xylan/chitin deacetylase (PgdA/CDA1 family)
MKEQGFKSVFPGDARSPRTGGGRQVILTFDDGRKEQLLAAEILEKYGFRGIFFVIPTRTHESSPHYLTNEDIARLARAGHRISVHGTDHRSLASSGSEAASAIAQAFQILEDSARVRPSAIEFAMPFGHYTPPVIDALATRYRYLMSVNPGYWDGASLMIPRMLIFHDVPLSVYREYLVGGPAFHPKLVPLTRDGAISDTVRFRVDDGQLPRELELFAVSADARGRSYQSHPLGDAATVRGDVLVIDLKKHRGRHFPADRKVIAYAVVSRIKGTMQYLSPGIMHWLEDPSTGPALRP